MILSATFGQTAGESSMPRAAGDTIGRAPPAASVHFFLYPHHQCGKLDLGRLNKHEIVGV
jgi:hypothetical protein